MTVLVACTQLWLVMPPILLPCISRAVHSVLCMFHGRVRSWCVSVSRLPPPPSLSLPRYAYSFYWAIVTFATLGYGDVTPSTTPEVVYVIFFGEGSGARFHKLIDAL